MTQRAFFYSTLSLIFALLFGSREVAGQSLDNNNNKTILAGNINAKAEPQKIISPESLFPSFNQLLPTDLFTYIPDRDVRFKLVVKINSTDWLNQPIKLNDASSLGNFDPNLLTKIIIHGWNAYKNDGSIARPVRAFLLHDRDYNLISVDWRKGSTDFNYIAAKDRVQITGQTIAKFVEFLISETGASMDDIHLIGFSLGAQVAGFCGKALNGNVGAIFGLEPALPGFPIHDSTGRLAATDAKYVEVLHTSGGKLGFKEPLGHVDFYPNGGTMQPGCGLDIWGDCAHPRAIHYFAEALNSDVGFLGRRCKEMRGMTSKKCRFMKGARYLANYTGKPLDDFQAIYWFSTANKAPYAVK